ncbi:cytochrome P450 [Methylobacterium sp. J-048]|uniref:cytochrome P450 n=1 Tax=Methylobacterium sp. J-048 TaxID=2836635 RepID=UPI001FBB20CF|nr:cytochrome P450 [Methylobacterium sp. J-048]MCJ2057185.1 cytochrome P450 [Methylobacterium sp. J-048]
MRTVAPKTPCLEFLEALPVSKRWQFAREWIACAPKPFFAQLRARRTALDCGAVVLVAGRAEVEEILSLPQVFSVALYKPKMGEFMLALDGTEVNYRDKAVMRAVLSWRDLPAIRDLAGDITDTALEEGGGTIDVVASISRLVPLRIVQRFFGFAASDADLLRWSYANQFDQFNNLPFDERADADAIHAAADLARGEMRAAFASIIPARLAAIESGTDLPDDVLTRLLRLHLPVATGFGMDRVVINVGGLLIGAIETTSEAVVNTLAELLSRPAIHEAARTAARSGPAAFDGYVWEALRFAPIVAFMFRQAETDHVLGRGSANETGIAKGKIVLPLSLSAMFDPNGVPEPERFDPTRPDQIYLHFGRGHHECLGRYVAGAMIPEIVRRILLRDDVRADGAVEDEGTPFPTAFRISYDGRSIETSKLA